MSQRKRERGRKSALLAAALFACVSCASADPPSLGVSQQGIIRGVESTPELDAVVLVMHYDAIQIGGGAAGCTGTMLTPRLVLTARHCVAVTDESASCDAAGNATFGGAVRGNHDAKKIYAFAGRERPDFLSGLDKGARGVEIIDDAAMSLCNHDIALVLLDRALPGVRTAPLRLADGPRQGESVTVVGFGVTDTTSTPAKRQQRGGVKVLSVGPAERLGPAEFRVDESGCAGDSGGPAIAESTGAVLGVLSRGGNDKGAVGPPEACFGAENVFTSVAKYRDLIATAYVKAGQKPWEEGEVDPATLPPDEGGEEEGGCGVGPGRGPRDAGMGLAGMIVIAACVRRRRAAMIAAR